MHIQEMTGRDLVEAALAHARRASPGIMLPFETGHRADEVRVTPAAYGGAAHFLGPRIHKLRVERLTLPKGTYDLAMLVCGTAQELAHLTHRPLTHVRDSEGLQNEQRGYALFAVLAACLVETAQVIPFATYRRDAERLSAYCKALALANEMLQNPDAFIQPDPRNALSSFRAARVAIQAMDALLADRLKMHLAALAPESVLYAATEDGWSALAQMSPEERGVVIKQIKRKYPSGAEITREVIADARALLAGPRSVATAR